MSLVVKLHEVGSRTSKSGRAHVEIERHGDAAIVYVTMTDGTGEVTGCLPVSLTELLDGLRVWFPKGCA